MSATMNTLYVSTEGAWLHKDHDSIVVRVDREERLRVPLLHVGSVVCFGRVGASPELMADLAGRSVTLSWISSSGRFCARVEGIPGGNVLLRRAQYRAADSSAASLALARSMVIGKIGNERQVLLHASRDADDAQAATLRAVAERLGQHLRAAAHSDALESLRGIEGLAAREYFSALPCLIKREPAAFSFQGRSRRPPRDRVNALLSFAYALLLQDCVSACVSVGLDPAVGYLHEDRPGRLSLALDLMEEFRAVLADRTVLTLINRGQLSAQDVRADDAEGYRLTDAGRRTFIVEYQRHKQAEVHHPFLDEQHPWGRLPHVQARLLARTLRGDLDVYPPLVVR